MATSRPGQSVSDIGMPSPGDPEVALGDGAEVVIDGSRTAWVTSPATTASAAWSSVSSSRRRWPWGRRRNESETLGDTAGGHHPHGLRRSGTSTCWATGMMFLLFLGMTVVGEGGLDRLEQLRAGRQVHRLAAGDGALHAERGGRCRMPVAGGDRHPPRRAPGRGRAPGVGVERGCRTLLIACSGRSVTRWLRGASAEWRPRSIADAAGVDVAVPDAAAADRFTTESPMPAHVL